MGILYVVGTPIGNLGDFSNRGKETLGLVDFIAAEDTRVTRKLLTHFGISKPLVSYNENNKLVVGSQIVEKLLSGQSCAIVSDAGMPCISDPGEDLVRLCKDHSINTVVIPGPSAVVSALSISGLNTARFSFEGFLSVSKPRRSEHLSLVSTYTNTLIFYEAPHKLLATLKDLHKHLGNRKISICRELTKIYEESLAMTLEEAVEYYESLTPKGEFVLVVEGAPPQAKTTLSFDDAVKMTKKLIADGQTVSAAAKEIANFTGYKKGDIYKSSLN